MRKMLALGCAAALVAVAACNRSDSPESTDVSANASGNVPAEIVAVMKARHENYEEIGESMKGINDQLKAGSPSVQVIQQHAARIAEFAPQVLSWFPEGSGPETGRETRAKAEIWSDAPTFRDRALAFETEATRFAQVAQSGDLAAIRAGIGALGDSCKNCHDRFRAPKRD